MEEKQKLATVQASKAMQSKDKVGIRVLTEWT
jgi:hypothetical protein